MVDSENSLSNEKTKIRELKTRINKIKTRYRLSLLAILILFFIWFIAFQNADSASFAILRDLGSAIGLALGSFVILAAVYYFIKFIIFLIKPDPDAPMVSKEEREKPEWEKVRLTACLNCMLVYDSRRTVCPECGKETALKEETKKEIIQS